MRVYIYIYIYVCGGGKNRSERYVHHVTDGKQRASS